MLDAAFFPEFNATTDPGAILGWINESVETVRFEALDAGVFASDAQTGTGTGPLREWSTLSNASRPVVTDITLGGFQPTCIIHRANDPLLSRSLRTVLLNAGYDACLRAQTTCGDQQYCRVDLFIDQVNEQAFIKGKAKILSALLATFRMIEQGCLNSDSDPLEFGLSKRETEVLTWTAEGKTTWETAQIICLSESTVNFHLRRAMKKLNAANKCNAAAIAIARGLISLRQ